MLPRLLCVLIVVAAAGCANQQPLKPSEALLEIVWEGEASSRLRSTKFVSVDGASIREKDYLYLEPGFHEVGLSYRFAGTRKQEVNLDVDVLANRRYSVKFDIYPRHPLRKPFGDPVFPHTEEAIIIALPIEVACRLGAQGVHAGKHATTPVEWASIYVASSDYSEGVIKRVRVAGSQEPPE